MDILSSAPTSHRLQNMQLVKDDHHIQIVPVVIFVIFFMFV